MRHSSRPLASLALASLALASLVCAFSLALPASAWQQARSARGAPLRLASPSLSIPTGSRAAGPFPPSAVADAFGVWFRPCSRLTIVEDSDDRPSPIALSVVPAGRWPYPPDERARTSLDLDPATGAIGGARIELNGAFAPFADGTAGDLRAVLAHELGHVLGLADSDEPSSLMARPGPADRPMRRALSPDDEQALCRLYPRPSHAEEAALLARQDEITRHDSLRNQWLAWFSLVISGGLFYAWWSIGRGREG